MDIRNLTKMPHGIGEKVKMDHLNQELQKKQFKDDIMQELQELSKIYKIKAHDQRE